MLGERLHGILNTQPEQPHARAIAMTAGALIGGAVSTVFNPSGALAEAGLIGIALGSLWQEFALGWRQAERDHQQRWQELNRFGGGRAIIERDGIHADDRGAVKEAHARVIEAMQKMQEDFQWHCQQRQLPCNPLINQVLQAFFLEFCGEREACTVYCHRDQCFYLTAVFKEHLLEVTERCAVEGQSTGEILRSLGLFYVRCDPQCKDLAEMNTFNFVLHESEYKVQPQPWRTPAMGSGTPAGPFADAYRGIASSNDGEALPRRRTMGDRRSAARHTAAREVGSAASPSQDMKFTVTYSDRLNRQLGALAKGGPTRTKLGEIVDDLRSGRAVGHVVVKGRQSYLATDINIEGMAGRNRWRLLYERDGEGFMLEGIADYHTPDKRIVWLK